jgi:predicted molibdopterin-dependent oxidoreductase YjgC
MSQGKSRFSWSEGQAFNKTVNVTFDGELQTVPAGISVAAALLGHDDGHFCRSAADKEKRAPYCLMGICFECLVEIDGLKNRQACLEPVYEGMSVNRQQAVMEEKNEENL